MFGLSLFFLSLHKRSKFQSGPERSSARRILARRQRTLDGEDRSETMAREGKASRLLTTTAFLTHKYC